MSTNNTNTIFIVTFYILSIYMGLNFSTPFLFWIILELNMVMFIVIMNSEQLTFEKMFLDSRIYYFGIQSLSSLGFLISASFMTEPHLNWAMMLFIILKMGLIPLSAWVFKMSFSLQMKSFALLITAQKILPMYFIFSSMTPMMLWVMIFNMMGGSIIMMSSTTMQYLLISSSIYSTLWMFMFFSISLSLGLGLYLLYSVSSYMLMSFSGKPNKMNKLEILMCSLMFSSGLPPFSIFFFKTLSLFSLSILSSMSSMLIWVNSFLVLVAYFSFFSNKFYNSTMMNFKISKKKFILLFISLSAMYMF